MNKPSEPCYHGNMKTRLALILALFGLFAPLTANLSAQSFDPDRKTLSNRAEISIITHDPGRDVYLAFGHTALWVHDPVYDIDTVFNYGVFSLSSLSDPLFIPRFLKGELDYMVYPFGFAEDAETDLADQNRVWYGQKLNLTAEEKNRLYQFLEWNVREENRVYRYDFVKDNCSTRIIDALEYSLGPIIEFDDPRAGEKLTWRLLISEKLERRPLWNMLMGLLLGSAADRQITKREALFMPEYFLKAMDKARITRNGESAKLAQEPKVLLKPLAPANYDSKGPHPLAILIPLALLAVGISALQILRAKKGKRTKILDPIAAVFDFFLFLAVGAFGSLAFFMSYMSTHTATGGNLNVLWLFPGHLIAAFGTLPFFRRNRVTTIYWGLFAAITFLILTLLPVWPQTLPTAAIPLMIIVGVRALSLAARTSSRKASLFSTQL